MTQNNYISYSRDYIIRVPWDSIENIEKFKNYILAIKDGHILFYVPPNITEYETIYEELINFLKSKRKMV